MVNEKYLSILFRRSVVFSLQTQLTDILCLILFLLGIIGNLLGLIFFSSSRRTWKISSVYIILATCSSITNLLCVIRYTTILHSTSRAILRQLVIENWWACKFYELSFSFRVISSWITLFWMFERFMCASNGLKAFFNQWKTAKFHLIIPMIIMTIILSCVVGPPVYMYQPEILENRIINSTVKTIVGYCQLHSKASIRWQKYFREVHIGLNHTTIRCLFSELIPAGAIILFNSYIIFHLIGTYRRLSQTTKEKSQNRSWMNIVLILHSLLFFTSLFSHIVGHIMRVDTHETWWILLSVLTNCSLNFYVYCLSGRSFRNEVHRFIQRLKGQMFKKFHISRHNRRRQSIWNNRNDDPINNLGRVLRMKKTSSDHHAWKYLCR